MASNRNDPRCETDSALNEPWIDVLGKALAGGFSRRTALKILAGAALSSVFGVTAACGSTNGTQATTTVCNPLPFPSDPPENALPGKARCKQVEAKANNFSLYQLVNLTSSNCHFKAITSATVPAYAAVTSSYFLPYGMSYTIPPPTQDSKTGQWSTTTSQLPLTFYQSNHTYQITWDVSHLCGTSSDACKQEYNRWQSDIATHEGRHIQNIEDIVNKTNDKQLCYLADRTYTGTGQTSAEAIKAAKQAVDDAIKQVISCMNAARYKLDADFHNEQITDPARCQQDKCVIPQMMCDKKCIPGSAEGCDPGSPCCTSGLGNPYCASPAGSTCCGPNKGDCGPGNTCCDPGGVYPGECCAPKANCCKSTDVNKGCTFNPCNPPGH